jgi:hypothetical protein
MIDRLFNSILRGFSWTLGRRAAYSTSPAFVWMFIAVVAVLWLMGVRL